MTTAIKCVLARKKKGEWIICAQMLSLLVYLIVVMEAKMRCVFSNT